jgi:hypothetical protein
VDIIVGFISVLLSGCRVFTDDDSAVSVLGTALCGGWNRWQDVGFPVRGHGCGAL